MAQVSTEPEAESGKQSEFLIGYTAHIVVQPIDRNTIAELKLSRSRPRSTDLLK